MIKTLIFDLDGTLLDTLEDLRSSLNFSLKKFGFPEKSMEEVRNSVGNGLKYLVTASLAVQISEADAAKVLQCMREAYALHYCELTLPYPGILAMLRSLKYAGFRLGIVSNKPDAMVQLLCKRFFDGLIDVAVGESEKMPRKPAPDMVFAAIDALGGSRSDAIYIGDSEVDLATARNAGLPCYSVGWGFRSAEELSASGAEHVYSSAEELVLAFYK